VPGRNASQRAEQRALLDQMRGLGMSRAEVAAEMARRYGLRPRAAWRIAWGWTLPEAADRYNALRSRGQPQAVTALTASRLSEWENWPLSARKPTVTGLCLLAEIYQCSALELIDVDDRQKLPADELLALDKTGRTPARPIDSSPDEHDGRGAFNAPAASLPALNSTSLMPAGLRRMRAGAGLTGEITVVSRTPTSKMPEDAGQGGWIDIDHLAMVAADESAEWASVNVGRLVPSQRIEQLRQDIRRLARTSNSVPPWIVLEETRRIRDQARRLVGRTCRPGQLSDLYLVSGQACALMSVASFHLAVWPAAIEHAEAAFVFADVAGCRSLQAWSRGMQGLIANWCGRPGEAVEVINAGLAIAPPGTARARLYCILARSWSQLGAPDQTRDALAAAERDRDDGADPDELHDGTGGEFGWGMNRQAMCAASALLRINDADGAVEQASEAILHTADTTSSLVRSMQARADLASAELARGQLEAAEAALAPVWDVPPEYRWHSLVTRLERVAGQARRPPYLHARGADELTGQITEFTGQSPRRDLPAVQQLPPRG
jgi:hypothetical protein